MARIVARFPWPSPKRRWAISSMLVGIILLLALVITIPRVVPRPLPPTSARITVDTQHELGTLSDVSVGLNVAVFDEHLLSDAAQTAVKNAGVGLLRFPGGLDSDLYHWQSHTLEVGKSDPRDTFDAYMGVAQRVGAESMITVNYGDGTAAEAAGWVQYANKGGPGYSGPIPTYTGGSRTGHTYGIKYWEVGNENYGDGTYGVTWENNKHAPGPLPYARSVVAYSHAMKAIDPTIHIGAVLTTPGIWPDGNTNPLSRRPWNQTVLSTACSAIDFVVLHWYAQNPGNETDAELLSSPEHIGGIVATVRDEIQRDCGAHASAVQIMVTETNSVSYQPGKQTVSLVNALFMADDYMTWLENGAANVDWWNLHDWNVYLFNNSPSLYGDANFGDYGILSTGLCAGSTCEPAADTPFPPYYALKMLSYLGRPGDTMVEARSDQSEITAHAIRQADGNLAILLINKDPSASCTVSFNLKGFRAIEEAGLYTYGKNDTSIQYGSGIATQIKLAPYSLTTIVFSPDGTTHS